MRSIARCGTHAHLIGDYRLTGSSNTQDSEILVGVALGRLMESVDLRGWTFDISLEGPHIQAV